jgi:hypothetical protein
MSGKIHTWDIATILKSVVVGIVLETILLGPSIPSILPWGHAGPETLPGLLSFLLNIPGFLVVQELEHLGFSINAAFLFIFVIQTLIISYFVFVILRWRKLIKGF